MALLTIRLDDEVLVRLKQRAWEQGVPFEHSVRILLAQASRDEHETPSQPRKPAGHADQGGRARLEHV
jgi:plasmid stability protein